jgi:hypothetical protein
VPVNTTRREMRWQSFVPLFMIDSPSGLSAPILFYVHLFACTEPLSDMIKPSRYVRLWL